MKYTTPLAIFCFVVSGAQAMEPDKPNNTTTPDWVGAMENPDWLLYAKICHLRLRNDEWSLRYAPQKLLDPLSFDRFLSNGDEYTEHSHRQSPALHQQKKSPLIIDSITIPYKKEKYNCDHRIHSLCLRFSSTGQIAAADGMLGAFYAYLGNRSDCLLYTSRCV